MAKQQKPTTTLERVYTIPLRKHYQKASRWKRTNKAVVGVRNFLIKHMKSQDVKLGASLNEKIWNHGAKNPPCKVKVTVTKDSDGVVRAELFGAKIAAPKKEAPKKQTPKADPKPAEKKPEAPKEEPKEPTTEEKVGKMVAAARQA